MQCCVRRFGRTPSRWQTAISQDIFERLEQAGQLEEQSMEQLYRQVGPGSEAGSCPHTHTHTLTVQLFAEAAAWATGK